MKCRICGNEIKEQKYCLMCGAPVNPRREWETECKQMLQKNTCLYQGIDADATTVLSGNCILNKKAEEEKEGDFVVSEEIEITRKFPKKWILISCITGIVLTVIGFFLYFHYM